MRFSIQWHSADLVAGHSWYSVVSGEPVIEHGKIRVEELQGTRITIEDFFEERFCFRLEKRS